MMDSLQRRREALGMGIRGGQRAEILKHKSESLDERLCQIHVESEIGMLGMSFIE
jgi:hypothetical protein